MSKLRSEVLVDSKRGPPEQRTRRAVIEGLAIEGKEEPALNEKNKMNPMFLIRCLLHREQKLELRPKRKPEKNRSVASKERGEVAEMAEMRKQLSLRKEQERLQKNETSK